MLLSRRGGVRGMAAMRGFKFDKLGESQSLSAQEVDHLDRVSMVSLKTLKIPEQVRQKLHNLAKQFVKKKDLEKLGRYVMQKVTSRNCVELPRILPSKLLNQLQEDEEEEAYGGEEKKKKKGRNKLNSLLEKKSYQCLKHHLGEYQNKWKDIEQMALAHAEDARHIGRKDSPTRMTFFPESSIAYTLHNFNSHYGVLYRILHEIRTRVPNFIPKKVLTYSGVPAVAVVAVNELYPSGDSKNNQDIHESNKIDIVAVESSDSFESISKYLTERIPNVIYQMNLYRNMERYNLVITSHMLLSLYDYNARNLYIKNMWSRLSTGGILIIVESGTPTGFRMIHSIRELFITELKYDKFHFLAPCPHESICPLALTGKDWCHFSQRTHRLSHHIYCKGSRAKNVDELKYSYLVIRKGEGPRTMYKSEGDALTPEEKSFFWPRVILPTIKSGKHVLIDVCSRPQNFERLVVTKSSSLIPNLRTKDGAILKGYGYKNARKLLWGDLFRFTKRISRPDARLYTPETTKQHFYRLYNRQKRRQNVMHAVDRESCEHFESRTVQFYGS
ncbi:mitochondrial ribosomal protein S22 precursor, putative [Plasmodium knowlesi strain H]|uniref:Mitochondrial ribosomal protein S22, putative n=3 Tax=Plasmodium knowlesi TaxID=5850 RepID=A0A5K1VI77_PLAKH|nr:uncharacterized protein PKNH_0611600 [Plasmodium knowlesi strain H]OTN68385.1 putative Mitochondrial ribosomal protein S22 [Plasmodium knowlesi]CAA9987166.1 ribosomal protein S22, mitochondrial, putative [Plasmodium knowlesi strain H]SBO23923.1 mitochondrial ribosomal protein S22 precursor, putative [Plasmodium knowlesi strain H]SBO25830.1 mitochondrial ribosomal protein S22 precursor, putative [Plasmodium knowlesi strain H]VVS76640.1 ribosomal protein S22, mitochondrial, putative [Plasmodi|eukprot:XP_002261790.1 [Plasmodium knowlesi strain H]